MKLFAVPLAIASLGLLVFPAVIVGGDPAPVGCFGVPTLTPYS